jgi:hypothetical protein
MLKSTTCLLASGAFLHQMAFKKSVNDETFHLNYIKHPACKSFIFGNNRITDYHHVINQHIISFNFYRSYTLADKYLCSYGYNNKKCIQFNNWNCNYHMDS